MDSCEINRQDINQISRGLWGTKSELTTVEDLNSGFAKRTYRLTFKDPSVHCLLHVWKTPSHNLTEVESKADWILAPAGLDVFKRNNEYLLGRDIRVPKIVMADDSRSVCDYDFALVEYIDSENFFDYIRGRDADVCQALLGQIDAQLRKLHAFQCSRPGLPLDERTPEAPCEEIVLENALLGLDLAAEYNRSIEEGKNQIQDAIGRLLSSIERRSTFHLIHGELSPEHVLINRTETVYLIDYEGLKFFDLEFEHSLMNARFGRHYTQFSRPDLDAQRMKYYTLIHYVGWNSFASEAVTRDSVDKTWAQGIMESSTREILKIVST